jgi:hypothetical protein
MAHQYADIDLLLADYLPELKSEQEKEAVERVLEAASAFVDSFCKRSVGYFLPASNSATMKRFRGEGKRFLRIPPTNSTPTVEGIESGTFYKSDGNGWLYFEITDLPETSSALESFDSYRLWQKGKLYKVTAKWGYAETPADIKEAVRQIVVKWYQTARGIFGTDSITPTGFVVERDVPVHARAMLENYIKREFER